MVKAQVFRTELCPWCGRKIAVTKSTGRMRKHFGTDSFCVGSDHVVPT